VSAILHHSSLLRLLNKSYFEIITFQPNFLCSNSFKCDADKLESLILNKLGTVSDNEAEVTNRAKAIKRYEKQEKDRKDH